MRIFACDIIQNAGISLKLPQIVMTTAQMLLQRVYHTPDYTFNRYPLDITGMAALFLGAKIEEYPRKAREVIDAFSIIIEEKFSRSQSQRRNFKLSSSDFEKVREELITAERRLLKNLGFNLLSSYPHKIIVNYYHAIVRVLDADHNYWTERDNNRLLQIAWNYCNDSLRTDVFIKYHEVAVACACIQLACEDTQMLFPKSTDGRIWYLLFTNQHEVEASMEVIRKLYLHKKLEPHDLKKFIHLTSFST